MRNLVPVRPQGAVFAGVVGAILVVVTSLAVTPSSDSLVHPDTGIRLLVLRDHAFPALQVLLPDQADSCRGIEVEFPEHVWGRHRTSKEVERLYLFMPGPAGRTQEKPPAHQWYIGGSAAEYEMKLGDEVKMTARAELEADGIRFVYEFANLSETDYEEFQPVTCVKLYSTFSDVYLERTYVYHHSGFDLLASETPQRLEMSRSEWLPCRYLVSFTWPLMPEGKRTQQREDGVTVYHKSRRVAAPLLATFSHDGHWLAATYTSDTGNVWSNPERTCHHADPSTELKPGETRRLELKTFLFQGDFNDLLSKVGGDSGSASGN